MPQPRAPRNFEVLGIRRRGFEVTRSPASAALALSSLRPFVQDASTPSTFDFYISPTGAGSASTGGTLANPWPISMLNNSAARSRYAGRRVGLLDGIYDLSGMSSYDGASALSPSPILNVAAGTASSQTVIAAVNPRNAELKLTSSGGTRKALPAIGQGPGGGQYGYVTISGLRITGGSQWHMSWWGVDPTTRTNWSQGIIIEDCDFSDCILASSDNNPAIWLDRCLNPIVRRCKFANIGDSGSGYGPSCVMTLSVRGLLFERNECDSTRTMVHDKHGDGSGGLASDGFSIRGNIARNLTHQVIIGLDTEYISLQPDDSYQESVIEGNLFVNCDGVWTIKIASPTRMSVTFKFNTVVIGSSLSGDGGILVGPSSTTSDKISYHSNIFDTRGFNLRGYGYAVISAGCAHQVNYNCYSATPLTTNIASPVGTWDGTTTVTTYTTLTAWRAALASNGSPSGWQDANSIQADPALDSSYIPTNSACLGTGFGGANMGHTGSGITLGAGW